MTEQPGTRSRLSASVQDLAAEVVSALRGGDHFSLRSWADSQGAEEPLVRATLRVLGADAALPAVLSSAPVDPADVELIEQTAAAYPPAATASPTVRWSHWAMGRCAARLRATGSPHSSGTAEPDATWLTGASWQELTRQLAALAALAAPGLDCAVARTAASRPVDVARGFVRAVRRQDWVQAAGAGRWLATLDGVPPSLGLDNGLEFIAQMGEPDARVALQVQAARMLRAGVRA